MSTRCSISYRDQELDTPGFHLWEDAFERLNNGDKSPVYLRLEGVQIHELATQFAGVSVTVQLPREMAKAMGLLPSSGENGK